MKLLTYKEIEMKKLKLIPVKGMTEEQQFRHRCGTFKNEFSEGERHETTRN